MAVKFTGTATGKEYEVGKNYKTPDGKTYQAQADGSFAPVGKTTGPSLKGSMGNPDVEWTASGADRLAVKNVAPGQNIVVAAMGGVLPPGATKPAAKPPTAQTEAVTPAHQAGKATAGAKTVINAAKWSGKDDPAQDNLLAGIHIQANPKQTNAELWEARYGDVVSAAIGIVTLGQDIGYTLANKVFGEGATSQQKLEMTANAVSDLGTQAVMGGGAMWDAVANAAADRKEWERNRNMERHEFDSAWDLREIMQYDEAVKAGYDGFAGAGNVQSPAISRVGGKF